MKSRWIHAFHQEEDVPSYTRLASCYDRIMNHVDYGEWAKYIVRLFKRFGQGVRRVVDGGCGTGSLAYALAEMGYRVVGFDRSLEMVRVARKKSHGPLWQGDLKTIGLSRTWDAFLCLYDTIQYLMEDELTLVLSNVKRVIIEGGLFIFDVVTENHILRYWAHYTERVRGDGWETMRRSWYDKRGRYQHTEFTITSHQEKKIFKEHHIQRIYRLEELEEMVSRSELRLVGRFDGFTMNPGIESSDRVHFVLRREAS